VADFDNIFDTAMARADDTVRSTMGSDAFVTSGAQQGDILKGVFDDPGNIGYAGAGIRVEGSSPSFFVKTSSLHGLLRLDTLSINSQQYWVDRIGPDDCGSCHIWLGSGEPPATSRRAGREGANVRQRP